MRKKIFVVCTLLAASVFADDLADSRRLAREAAAAYKAKDYAVLLEKSRAASDLRPGHAGLLYNVAAALALNGSSDEAMDVLERVGAMGVAYDPAKDGDFASLRSTPRFSQIVETFARNAAPRGTTSRAFTIDDRGVISEGLAYDPRTRRFFVSSVRHGVIYARDRRGRVTKFATDPHHGIFGMAVDAARRRLWAAASKLPAGPAAVLEIGLDSGKILGTMAPPDQKHIFGDVVVAADGRVFVSDSISPSVYVIDHGAIEPFIQDGPFGSLQGLAISSDGRILYAADYARGIFAVDLATRDVRLLPLPAGTTLLGVDGLYALGKSTFIATQNGINPQRVIRIALAPGGLAVQAVDVLASNEADFDDITLGVAVGRDFYFNAASQWDLFGDGTGQPDPSKVKPALVLRVAAQE